MKKIRVSFEIGLKKDSTLSSSMKSITELIEQIEGEVEDFENAKIEMITEKDIEKEDDEDDDD